jgi:hypothetical protein
MYGGNFDYPSLPYFIDVSDTHWAFEYVQKMRGDDITTGCGSGNYCPVNLVTRAQMGAFLARALLGMQ